LEFKNLSEKKKGKDSSELPFSPQDEEFLSPNFIERLSGGTETPLILWLYFGANFHHILRLPLAPFVTTFE